MFHCGRQGKTLAIDETADVVEIAFEKHFYRTPTEPSGMEYAMMKESDYDWEREGDPVADVIDQYVDCSQLLLLGKYAETPQSPALSSRNIHGTYDGITTKVKPMTGAYGAP